MSVIAVQAGVANHVIDERPELVRQALGTIEVTAREGLVEMRRLLGVLRTEENDGEGIASGPAEGLRDLDRLLEQFRSAGLQLNVKNPDEIGDLPAALDISAYRVVQEGLTNVLRHGGPAVELTIRRSEAALLIEIRDDGRPRGSAPSGPAGSGHGLTGIRERAALFGGTLEAEQQPGGGFRLCVELPIGQAAEPR
jgi:signal transduction histidine kinase